MSQENKKIGINIPLIINGHIHSKDLTEINGPELLDWAAQVLPMKRSCLCSKVPETLKEKTALFDSMVNFQTLLRFSTNPKKGEEYA